MIEKIVSIKRSDFASYGCVKCGCMNIRTNISDKRSVLVACARCNACFILVDDKNLEIKGSPLVDHPLKDKIPEIIFNENTCVCCGKVIPEGVQVCIACERS